MKKSLKPSGWAEARIGDPLEELIALIRRGHMVRGIARHIIVKHADVLQRPVHVNRTRDEARRRAEQALAELKEIAS